MKRFSPALAFLVVAILAYGLMLPSLGFYWDDLPMSWIRYQLGPEAMTRYFSSNRPVWGMLYQVTTRVLPHVPIYWQVLALLLRALTGVLVWSVVRHIWHKREIFALMVAFFFLLYPGFNQQWGSYLYSHFFIVINFFLASLYFNLRALDEPRRARLFTILALVFSALNLWMMEYFFFLELVRPFIIFFALRSRNTQGAVRNTLTRSLPYIVLWIAAVLSRMFIFNNQVYSTSLLGDLRTDFLPTLARLLQIVLASFWTVSGSALGQIFQLPSPSLDGWRVTVMVAAVALLVFLLTQYAVRKTYTGKQVDTYTGNDATRNLHLLSRLSPIILSLLAFLTAGWPLWLIEFPPTLAHPTSRFTLPFMFGASLLWAGLLDLIPWPRWKYVLAGLLIALMAGRQSFWMNDYRREWESQKTLFWQMTWRAPGLEPNTTVLLNDRAFLSPSATGILPPVDLRVFNFYADNSLAAALNWVYAPDNHSDRMDYLLLYPKSRIGGSLPSFEKDQPINYDFLAGTFEGNTSQVVAFYYAPPGCLRLLDPEIDALNRFIPDETLMRESAALSSSAWILPEKTATLPNVYGSEPSRGWCYYFEKADLARQQKDWEEIVRIGEVAFALDDHPNDPVERFVFIEGYAHGGDWARAQELSVAAYRVSKDYMAPMLCSLWTRIARETAPSADQASAVDAMFIQFSCAK
ncbi:MAG: hypothetical protein ACOYZ6_05380 [Chloroflexota bacterium]